MKNITLFLLALFMPLLCIAEKPIKTKSNEAIIFGRFILDTNAQIDHQKVQLNFLTSPKGSSKITIGQDGFFCMKIQIGDSFTDYIKYKEGGDFRKILTQNCLTLSLSEADKAYYVGDIFMKWTPTERDKIKKGFSIGIGMGTYNVGGAVSVPISENYTPGEDCPGITIKEIFETIDQFHQIYPDDHREVITQFMDLE